MTDLTLYWLIPKDRSTRVRWLLQELNIAFSEKRMNARAGKHRQSGYLDVNSKVEKELGLLLKHE
jgi:glutathione S-transferase